VDVVDARKLMLLVEFRAKDALLPLENLIVGCFFLDKLAAE
jgi:hypothetical protein